MTDSPAACPLPLDSQTPGDDRLVEILAAARNVAVVGASPNPARTSNAVALWLMEHTPFELFLVNPRAGDGDIDGRGFYACLADMPVTPDLVVVFRRGEDTPPVATDAVAAHAKTLWLQLGIISEEAHEIAVDAGLDSVQNRCIKVEYARLRDRILAA